MNTSLLPTRRTTAFVLIPLAAICIAFALVHVRDKRLAALFEREQDLAVVLSEVNTEYHSRDSDGDLLKDWEEFLHQTDVDNPDTDGDGSDDYIESRDPSRDPLTPDAEFGSYATSSSGVLLDATEYDEHYDSLNATEQYAREFLHLYIKLKQTGNINNTSAQDVLVREAARKVDARQEASSKYDSRDLVFVPDSLAHQQSYKLSYKKALRQLEFVEENDILLLAQYTENKNEAALEEMKKNQLAYESFAQDMSQVSAPQAIKELHVELVNKVADLVLHIEIMRQVEQDPLGAVIAVGDYAQTRQAINKVAEDLRLYFNTN